MKRFSQRKSRNSTEFKRELQIVDNSTGFYWNWSKLNAITSQTLGFYQLHSPILLLCSSIFLNWSLMVERDGYLPSSQHLLRSIGRLASHLLSRPLGWSYRSYKCCVYAACCLSPLIESLYRNQLVWPILTLPIQLHLVHCITHSNCFLVCFMVHWTKFSNCQGRV
jgi:hypothetical protein